MIESLTKEQEALIPGYLAKWHKIGKEYRPINRPKAIAALKKYLALADIHPQKFIFLDSPYECNIGINMLHKTNFLEDVKNGINDPEKTYNEIKNQTLDYYFVGLFYQSGNIISGYTCLYDFVINELLPDTDAETLKVWEIFKEITEELHYFFVFKDVVFCSEKPKRLEFKGDNLHCEDAPSVEYADGYSMYTWNGTIVPEKLIMKPNEITKQDILEVSNAEVRRCFMEKLGADKFYNLLSDGNGCRMLDSAIDNQGNVMQLWETLMPDAFINKHVQFLKCECPSTGRIYYIYPPNQSSKTAKEAKASTFSNEQLTYRHGDVGFKYRDEETTSSDALIET